MWVTAAATVTFSHITVRIVRMAVRYTDMKTCAPLPSWGILLFIIVNGITEWPLSLQPSIISHAMRHAPMHCTINSSRATRSILITKGAGPVWMILVTLSANEFNQKQSKRREDKKSVRTTNHNVRYDKSATQQPRARMLSSKMYYLCAPTLTHVAAKQDLICLKTRTQHTGRVGRQTGRSESVGFHSTCCVHSHTFHWPRRSEEFDIRIFVAGILFNIRFQLMCVVFSRTCIYK